MLVFPDKKIAFFHIPKCGGTSVRKMLEPFGGVERGDGQFAKHTPLNELGDTSEFEIFANIRNPFDRICSLYANQKYVTAVKQFENVSFTEYFYGRYLPDEKPQHEYLFLNGELPKNINLVKLENASYLWPVIVYEYFGKEVEMPHENKSDRQNMLIFDTDMTLEVEQKEGWAVEQYA